MTPEVYVVDISDEIRILSYLYWRIMDDETRAIVYTNNNKYTIYDIVVGLIHQYHYDASKYKDLIARYEMSNPHNSLWYRVESACRPYNEEHDSGMTADIETIVYVIDNIFHQAKHMFRGYENHYWEVKIDIIYGDRCMLSIAPKDHLCELYYNERREEIEDQKGVEEVYR